MIEKNEPAGGLALKFPKCVAAVGVAEGSLWKLGDALVTEVADPTSSAFQAVHDEIERVTGSDYAVQTLQAYRRTAALFTTSIRERIKATGVKVSFSVCTEITDTGDAENVFALIKGTGAATKKSKILWRQDVRRLLSAWREREDRDYNREVEKRRKALADAKARKKSAQDRMAGASEEEKKKITKEIKKALADIEANKVAPPKNTRAPLSAETVPEFAIVADMTAEVSNARKGAEWALTTLASGGFSDEALHMFEDDVAVVVKGWTDVLASIRAARGGKPNLKVVS